MADIEVAGLVAKLSIDDSDLEQSMASLNRQMRIAKSEFQAAGAGLDGFGKGTDGLKNKSQGLTKQLDIQAKRVAKLQEEHAKSVEEKGKDAVATQKLETQLNKSVAEYNKLHGELQRVNKELAVQSSSWTTAGQALEKAGGKIQSIGKGMESAGKSLTKNVTLPLVAAGGLAFKTAMDYESAFAGVIKTVDATDQELAKLSDGIRDMAKEMPMAATEIAGIAEAAGQLGIEVPNIMGFTRVMADLGVATNMSAETAATSLARLANITQMPQTEFDKLGSTIVALGNNLATTESEIVEMGLRIAGAGKQVGLTEAEIMGFAGALSSVGIEAQAGGSSISKLMIDMSLAVEKGGGRLKDFAKVAGMSSKDFQKAFKDDAAGAIIEFITGLSTAEERGMSAIKILDDMEIKEVRLRDALLRAAGAGDLFNESIEIGTKAWEENIALQTEAEQRYSTTESQLQILKNRATDVGITLGQELIPAAMDALEAAEPLFKAIENGARAFSEMDKEQQKTILKWAGIALAAGPVLSVTGKLTTTFGGLVSGIGKASTWIGSFAKASKGASIAAGGMAQSTGLLASVFSPAGLAIGATALAVGGLIWAYNESKRPAKEAGEAAKSFADSIAGWESEVNSAESALAGLNSELIFSAEEMSELERNIRETQGKIIGIAEIAASESRTYTEEERKQIEELIGLLHEYTEEKYQAHLQKYNLLTALAQAEVDMSIERSNELVKGAQDTRTELYAMTETAYADEIALAEEMYGHLGAKDKKAYQDAIDLANQQRAEQLRIADEGYARIVESTIKRYSEQNKEDLKYIENLASSGAELKRLEKEKADYIEEQTQRRIVAGQDGMTQAMIQAQIQVEAWWKYNKDTKEAYKDLEKAFKEAEEANLGSFVGMLNTIQQYGGDIPDEFEWIVSGIMDAMDGLPADAKKALEDVMDGMIRGIEAKENKLYTKASNVAKGVLDRTRKVYQTQSPSKAMKEIYEQVMAGAEIPMTIAETRIPEKAGRIANSVLDMSRPPEIPERLIEDRTVTTNTNQKVDHSGTIRVEGVNNANELVAVVEAKIMDNLRWEARMA
jgi:TP901 family phage tail tape measure protein